MGAPSQLDDLTQLTHAFSAAAIDPALWEAAMDTAARVTGSAGAVLLPLRGHLPTVPVSESVGDLFEAYSRGGWYSRDARHAGVPAMLRNGVMSDFDLTGAVNFARDPFYQELLAPFGMRWFAGVKIAAGDDLWCLAIQRSLKEGPLSSSDLRRLGALSQSLSSAAALARAVGFARADAASDALAMSGSAAILIDRFGEILRINKAAEQILGSQDLRIVKRRLICWDSAATAALDRTLRDLIWRTDDSSLRPALVLPRREGYPVLAYPSRLSAVAADCFSPCQAVVVLVDLEGRVGLVESDLIRAFNLTPAEARLANRLLGGASVEVAAKELCVAYETSRNQMKAIFQKTGTHRQGQLISLLAHFSAPPKQGLG
jgi:DNA-binding CsgD family transcriptional regulator